MEQIQPTFITKKETSTQLNFLGLSLVIFIISQMVLDYIRLMPIDTYTIYFNRFDFTTIMMMILAAATLIFSFVPFSLNSILLKLNVSTLFTTNKGEKNLFIKALIFCIGFQLIATFIASNFLFFSKIESIKYPFLGNFSNTALIFQNLIYYFVIVVIRSVCEEFIFRGVLLKSLANYGNTFAIVASSLLFAFSQPTLVQAIPAFFIGIVLATTTFLGQSLFTTINVHIGVSTFFFIIEIIPKKYFFLISILIIIAYILFFRVAIDFRKKPLQMKIGSQDKLGWQQLFQSPTMLVYTFLFLYRMVHTIF